jgi:tetratricopeptide (TPR) repeat protein
MMPGLALALASSLGLALGQPTTPATSVPGCPSPTAALPVSPTTRASSSLTLTRCTVADLDAGRWVAADARLLSASRSGVLIADDDGRREWQALVMRLSARRALDAGRWTVSARIVLPHDEALPWAGPLVRGLSSARAAWASQDSALLSQARRELAALEGLARNAGPVSDAEVARLAVQAALAGAQYERDEMQVLMESARDLAVRLDDGDERRVRVVLPREQQADLLRVTDRYAAAAEMYREILAAEPSRVQSRIGLAEAYRRLGYAKEADVALDQARALWSGADPEAIAMLPSGR